jgi:hypothetical protein
VQIEIQIVDTYETLETPVVIGSRAFDNQINRTLLVGNLQELRALSHIHTAKAQMKFCTHRNPS